MASGLIELSVGGTYFAIGRDKILKYPNSLLAKMFFEDDVQVVSEAKKRKLEPAQKDSKGFYFLDRYQKKQLYQNSMLTSAFSFRDPKPFERIHTSGQITWIALTFLDALKMKSL